MTPAPAVETALTPEQDYEYFQKKLFARFGIDLHAYKPEQMRRRLIVLMQRHNLHQFTLYFRLLETSKEALAEFRDFFTINVSEFFRDTEKFNELKTHVLPQLLATRPQLRIWSAGCSYGAEPYTVALLLREVAPGRTHVIQGTDIDDTILERARAGDSFTDNDVRNVPAGFRPFFSQTAPGKHAIAPEIRRLVTFQKHDLTHDPASGQFDLILCRNVVIYFTDEAKLNIYGKFFNALRPGGVLFIGATETVPPSKDLPFKNFRLGFYQKP